MAPKKKGSSRPLGLSDTSRDDSAAPRDERSVIKHFQDFLKANAAHCQNAWERAEENQRFASGGKNQWAKGAWDKRANSGRPVFSFPDVELATRALSGREITARFEPTFLSRSPDDGPWTNLLREAVRYVRQLGSAENVESDAFRDLTIDNYSVISKDQVWDGDEPHGRTEYEHPPLWEHVWDRLASKVCFTDRSADARGYYVSIDDFLMAYPDQAEKIQERVKSGKGAWVSESVQTKYRYPWSAFSESRQYIKRAENQIFLMSYHWRQREKAWLATVPAGLDPHPVGPKAWADLAQILGFDPSLLVNTPKMWAKFRPLLEQAAASKQIDPNLALLARPRLMKMEEEVFTRFQEEYAKVFGAPPDAMTPEEGQFKWGRYEAVLVGDDLIRRRRLPFRHFPRIYMTAVPFKQITGTNMQSVVDSMKDATRFKNFVISLAASHLQRSQKMGLIYRPGVFEDENDLETRMSEPFFLIRTRPGAQIDDANVRFVDGAGFPHGLDRFLDMADQAAWRGTGLNPNTLGSLQDPRRVSGTVFQALADAVMTVQSWEFNSLRTMKILSGELDLDFMAEYWDPDDLRDIVGPEKAKLVPDKAEWKHKLRYDAVTTEVPTSKSEREQAWEFMSRQGTAEKAIQGGWMPPWIMVKMMPDSWLPEEDRKAWLDWMDAKGIGPNSAAQPPQQPTTPPQQGGAEQVQ